MRHIVMPRGGSTYMLCTTTSDASDQQRVDHWEYAPTLKYARKMARIRATATNVVYVGIFRHIEVYRKETNQCM